MKRFLLVCLLFAAPTAASAQAADALRIGVRYSATAANAPPGQCGCFLLQGAALDAGVPLLPRLQAVVEVAGSTTGRVPSSTRGMSTITLMAGPRYSMPVRRFFVNAQALFGAVHGFDGNFIVTTSKHTDTSTNFAMALGGSLDVPLRSGVSLRPAQVDYLQTNLPNGVDNRQQNIRFGAGVVFALHLPRR